jgi:hypothetical protein
LSGIKVQILTQKVLLKGLSPSLIEKIRAKEHAKKALIAGTQFACFASTKVQTLTPASRGERGEFVQARCGGGAARARVRQARRGGHWRRCCRFNLLFC